MSGVWGISPDIDKSYILKSKRAVQPASLPASLKEFEDFLEKLEEENMDFFPKGSKTTATLADFLVWYFKNNPIQAEKDLAFLTENQSYLNQDFFKFKRSENPKENALLYIAHGMKYIYKTYSFIFANSLTPQIDISIARSLFYYHALSKDKTNLVPEIQKYGSNKTEIAKLLKLKIKELMDKEEFSDIKETFERLNLFTQDDVYQYAYVLNLQHFSSNKVLIQQMSFLISNIREKGIVINIGKEEDIFENTDKLKGFLEFLKFIGQNINLFKEKGILKIDIIDEADSWGGEVCEIKDGLIKTLVIGDDFLETISESESGKSGNFEKIKSTLSSTSSSQDQIITIVKHSYSKIDDINDDLIDAIEDIHDLLKECGELYKKAMDRLYEGDFEEHKELLEDFEEKKKELIGKLKEAHDLIYSLKKTIIRDYQLSLRISDEYSSKAIHATYIQFVLPVKQLEEKIKYLEKASEQNEILISKNCLAASRYCLGTTKVYIAELLSDPVKKHSLGYFGTYSPSTNIAQTGLKYTYSPKEGSQLFAALGVIPTSARPQFGLSLGSTRTFHTNSPWTDGTTITIGSSFTQSGQIIGGISIDQSWRIGEYYHPDSSHSFVVTAYANAGIPLNIGLGAEYDKRLASWLSFEASGDASLLDQNIHAEFEFDIGRRGGNYLTLGAGLNKWAYVGFGFSGQYEIELGIGGISFGQDGNGLPGSSSWEVGIRWWLLPYFYSHRIPGYKFVYPDGSKEFITQSGTFIEHHPETDEKDEYYISYMVDINSLSINENEAVISYYIVPDGASIQDLSKLKKRTITIKSTGEVDVKDGDKYIIRNKEILGDHIGSEIGVLHDQINKLWFYSRKILAEGGKKAKRPEPQPINPNRSTSWELRDGYKDHMTIQEQRDHTPIQLMALDRGLQRPETLELQPEKKTELSTIMAGLPDAKIREAAAEQYLIIQSLKEYLVKEGIKINTDDFKRFITDNGFNPERLDIPTYLALTQKYLLSLYYAHLKSKSQLEPKEDEILKFYEQNKKALTHKVFDSYQFESEEQAKEAQRLYQTSPEEFKAKYAKYKNPDIIFNTTAIPQLKGIKPGQMSGLIIIKSKEEEKTLYTLNICTNEVTLPLEEVKDEITEMLRMNKFNKIAEEKIKSFRDTTRYEIGTIASLEFENLNEKLGAEKAQELKEIILKHLKLNGLNTSDTLTFEKITALLKEINKTLGLNLSWHIEIADERTKTIKLIILNYPPNPTGVSYEDLAEKTTLTINGRKVECSLGFFALHSLQGLKGLREAYKKEKGKDLKPEEIDEFVERKYEQGFQDVIQTLILKEQLAKLGVTLSEEEIQVKLTEAEFVLLKAAFKAKGIEIKDKEIQEVLFQAQADIYRLKKELEAKGEKIDEKTTQTILLNAKIAFIEKILSRDDNYKKFDAEELSKLKMQFGTLSMMHPLYTENKLLFTKKLLLEKYLKHLKLYEKGFMPDELETLAYFNEHKDEFTTYEYEYIYFNDLDDIKEIAQLYEQGKYEEIRQLLKTKYKGRKREKITSQSEVREFKPFLSEKGFYAVPILIKKKTAPYEKVKETIINKLLAKKLQERLTPLMETGLKEARITAGKIAKIDIYNISGNYTKNMAEIIQKALRGAGQGTGDEFDFKKFTDILEKIKAEYGYHLTWKLMPRRDGKIDVTLTIIDKTTLELSTAHIAGGYGTATGWIGNVGLKGINILDTQSDADIDFYYGQTIISGKSSVSKVISEDDNSLRTSTTVYVAKVDQALTGTVEQNRLATYFSLSKIINEEFTVSGAFINRSINDQIINSISAGVSYNPNWFKPLTLFLSAEKGLGHSIYKFKGGGKLQYTIPKTDDRLHISHHAYGVAGLGDDYYLIPFYQGELVRGSKDPFATGRYGWSVGTDINVTIVEKYFGMGLFFDVGGIGPYIGSPEFGFGPQAQIYILGNIGYNILSGNIFIGGNLYSW